MNRSKDISKISHFIAIAMVNTKRSAHCKASRKRQNYRWHTKWSEISGAITEYQKYRVSTTKPQKIKVKTKRLANSNASKKRQKDKRMLQKRGPATELEVLQGGKTGLANGSPTRAYNELVFHGIYFEGNDVFAKEEAQALSKGFRRILHARTKRHVLLEQDATSQLQTVVDKLLDKRRNVTNQLLIISYSGHGSIKDGQLVIGSCKE